MNTRMKTPMRTLGIILARAGSAGLADKHLRPLCGRPVLDYTFDHALASDRLTATVLSTDCPRLTLMALARGIRVIQRPPELATSTASVQDAMLHAMETFQSNGGISRPKLWSSSTATSPYARPKFSTRPSSISKKLAAIPSDHSAR